jgi:hypothetical protein
MNTENLMIDIETLATEPGAAIVSIAAVKFDPFDDYLKRGIGVSSLPTLNLLIDLDSQTDRVINDDTVTWWSQQSTRVQESIFGEGLNRVSLADGLDQLHRFVWNSVTRIWAQGTHFDITILEHAYRSVNRAYPWQYWVARDSRTLLDLVPVDLPPATHDALEDCYRQIVGVQRALAQLGVNKFVR